MNEDGPSNTPNVECTMDAVVVDPRQAAAQWGAAKKDERLVMQACQLALDEGCLDEVWRTLDSGTLTREAKVYLAKQALDMSPLPVEAKRVLKQLLGGAERPRSRRRDPDKFAAFRDYLHLHPNASKRSLAQEIGISPTTALAWKRGLVSNI